MTVFLKNVGKICFDEKQCGRQAHCQTIWIFTPNMANFVFAME